MIAQPIDLGAGGSRIFNVAKHSDKSLFDLFYIDQYKTGGAYSHCVMPGLQLITAFDVARTMYNHGIEVWWNEVPFNFNSPEAIKLILQDGINVGKNV